MQHCQYGAVQTSSVLPHPNRSSPKKTRHLFLGVEAKQERRKLWRNNLFFLGNMALPTFYLKLYLCKILTV